MGILLRIASVAPCSPLLKAQIADGMLGPWIDSPGKPFSDYWHPSDVLGALYDPVASEVTR